jgi:hypothetical protein
MILEVKDNARKLYWLVRQHGSDIMLIPKATVSGLLDSASHLDALGSEWMNNYFDSWFPEFLGHRVASFIKGDFSRKEFFYSHELKKVGTSGYY